MPIIRLYTVESFETAKLIAAKELNELKSKAVDKIGFNPDKLVLKEDGSEIDDQEIFIELLNTFKNNLEVVALKLGEEFRKPKIKQEAKNESFEKDIYDDNEDRSPKNKKSDDSQMLSLLKMKKDLEKLKSGTKDNSESDSSIPDYEIKRERNKQMLLEKELKKLEFSKTLENERLKREELQRKLEKLKETRTVEKTATSREVHDLELKCAKLELYNKRVDALFKELKKAEKVDICFMVDCTGSMSSYISEAKDAIHKVMNKLSARFKDFSMRFAFVGYRDIDDGPGRVEVFKFSQNPDIFRSFVNSIAATGGADECEDIFGGIEEVLKLEWINMSKVLFHIGDAPCHGSRFHSGANDSYPGGDPRGLKLEDLMKGVASKNLNYYFAKINNSTIKMIEEFDAELEKYNGSKINVVDLKAVHELTETVAASVTATIMTSKAISMSLAKGKKQKEMVLEMLNWDIGRFRPFEAELFKVKFEFSLSDLKTHEINYSKRPVRVFIAPKPFAKGSLRFAHCAFLDEGLSSDKCSYIKSVIKESRFIDPNYNTMKYIKESIESQIISIFLSEEFNKVSPSKKSIRFVDVNFIKLENGNYYSIEEFFDGSFMKWSNNAGFVNEEKYSATLDAFAHWTYVSTNEYLVVTDLQGCNNGSGYVLTDPAITCPDDFDRFSSTNLGKKGLRSFYESHECNHICESLKLKKHRYQLKPTRVVTGDMTKLKE